MQIYSKIPILRPPEIKTILLLGSACASTNLFSLLFHIKYQDRPSYDHFITITRLFKYIENNTTKDW